MAATMTSCIARYSRRTSWVDRVEEGWSWRNPASHRISSEYTGPMPTM
jgi:hypothetical protein